MPNKFPESQPEHHTMEHIGNGEFYCPICHRRVKFNGRKIVVMKDSRGNPMQGDLFAYHSGTTIDGFTMSLQQNPDYVDLDPDIWEYWE